MGRLFFANCTRFYPPSFTVWTDWTNDQSVFIYHLLSHFSFLSIYFNWKCQAHEWREFPRKVVSAWTRWLYTTQLTNCSGEQWWNSVDISLSLYCSITVYLILNLFYSDKRRYFRSQTWPLESMRNRSLFLKLLCSF